ncbi:hypothetical protein PBRA_005017 [Plasmodiophora brassicae]|uniref:Uncharacterized protein n=1 Tax=Plasmodiophora brassicae TaxID=37360 RepID=A0A0G4IM69_PLABS|nr:hypothetical protein PBRA_005017 [Plasmodiophora brassicae]
MEDPAPAAPVQAAAPALSMLLDEPLKLLSKPIRPRWTTSMQPRTSTGKGRSSEQSRSSYARELWDRIRNIDSSPFVASQFSAHVDEILARRASKLARSHARARAGDPPAAGAPQSKQWYLGQVKKQSTEQELDIPEDLKKYKKKMCSEADLPERRVPAVHRTPTRHKHEQEEAIPRKSSTGSLPEIRPRRIFSSTGFKRPERVLMQHPNV